MNDFKHDISVFRPSTAQIVDAQKLVISVLKTRFNNLSAEEVSDLAGKIVVALEGLWFPEVELP